MQCPHCEKHIAWDWLEDAGIEPDESFRCPHCGETLRYEVDEDTYHREEHVTVKTVKD